MFLTLLRCVTLPRFAAGFVAESGHGLGGAGQDEPEAPAKGSGTTPNLLAPLLAHSEIAAESRRKPRVPSAP